METSSFIHPAIGFLALAAVLPFLRGQWWNWLLPAPAVLAVFAVFTMTPGDHLTLHWLGQTLLLGRVDKLSLVFAQVFAVMSVAGMLYAMHVKDRGQHIAAALYVSGGFGCVFAGDYLTLFVFWELMSIGSTFLVLLNRTRESVLAGFRYFLYHTAGGLLLLAGLLLRYKALGTWEFTAMAPSANAPLYEWLILAGFCVNAAVVPLHAWLPDAYPRGTVTGSVFMCAYTTKTAVYVLARGFAGWEILAAAGTVMAVYGVLYACIENNARRILSYHIVSQVGYMVAGIGVGTAMTLNGAVAHAYAHILYKGLLFMGTGCLLYAAGTAKLDKLGGLAARLPWVMVLYMVAALSISGMPVFNGFISKTMTITGAAEAHRTLVALGLEIAAVGTFISVGIKLPYFAFWGGKPTDNDRVLAPIPWNMYAGMSVLAVLCILQGVAPSILYAYLPFEVEHPYVPWSVWHVLQSLLLLGFSGLAFYLLRKVITPHEGLNLDVDIAYRAVGTGALRFVCRPLAFLDDRWTEAYRTGGLRGLMGIALGSVWFDRQAIDGVVDGSARTVRGIGGLGARTQNGSLQDYLGLAAFFALCVFGLVWYLG
ncbi:Na(+)/H(+) antiporter subunit D [Nitratidesulfovibrio liaohensis]|uniref:Na(+)/H(+) antiporter subunit D n=1 Tax=Nitratidesulfovibrio liaohensis TaxID=2604158 RepID=UPI0014239A3E|nr:Na(+)/H(+) antiporter subunit D [Nitratidesulfovibrio liaohensis]NHZ47682.1 Na(+)/H(+) antiporter subunit D [Nitratidesulfovibrio liaohensis]